MPLHALSAADFPTVRAEAFDEHVVPADTKLEARPRAPTVYLQWVRQAENMAHAFALVYGHEYREPIMRFLRHLQHLREGNDHQYPFSFIADAWEEVFWRETEEIRHAVASLLKTMGKETSRKEDFVAAALVARSDGSGPALRLPTVWDYRRIRKGTSLASPSKCCMSEPCGFGGTTPTKRASPVPSGSKERRRLSPAMDPPRPPPPPRPKPGRARTPRLQELNSRATQRAKF